MPKGRINITPKRSVALFAFVSILTIGASYLLLLLLAVGCIYLPYLLLLNTQIMAVQVVLLFLGGIAVAATMLWSLLPRRDKFDAPGPLLDRLTQPKLFREIDQIADALNEQVPREVYLIEHPNAFVADRGGMLGFGSRRVMGIGLPLFSILNVSELRAVLAHEFAHFYSGDTSLGPWVYGVHSALIRSFQNMANLEKIGHIHILRLLFTLITLIIKKYFAFFLGVISFLSRKQEHRSDELACLIAGKQPAIRGLEKIHGAAPFWRVYWVGEVAPIIGRNCIPDIGEGFRRFLAVASIAEFVNASIAEERKSTQTSALDTHPPLADRIAAMERLQVQDLQPDELEASSLLDQLQSAELFLVEEMNPQIPKGSLQHVAWDDVGTLVTIPFWRSEVAKFGPLLLGKKAVSLPDLLKQLPEIGSRLPDPKGTLLTPKQRTERVAHLLGIAVSLILLEKGWKVHIQPAVLQFSRDGETLDAFGLVNHLLVGTLSPEDWVQKCLRLSIAEETLGVVKAQTIPTAPSA
jgi:heat shock protein HtpX